MLIIGFIIATLINVILSTLKSVITVKGGKVVASISNAIELYDRVKLLAKHYNMSINKMVIRLIEIGYMKMIGDDSYDS